MEREFFLIVLGMALVTYLPRAIPLLTLTEMQLPKPLLRWLSFIPVAVLAALLAPELIFAHGQIDISLGNPYLMAALPAFFVAGKTRSLFGTVLVGMVVVMMYRNIG